MSSSRGRVEPSGKVKVEGRAGDNEEEEGRAVRGGKGWEEGEKT